MSLRDQIQADMKQAMKNKEGSRLGVLRFLQSAIKNKEIEVRPSELTDKDVVAVVTKQVKQRKESIAQFKEGGRKDLVEKESFEISVLEAYLPQQMSREHIEKVISEVIAAVNATSIKQMGAVMKEVLAKTAGAADAKLVSEIVKSKLQ